MTSEHTGKTETKLATRSATVDLADRCSSVSRPAQAEQSRLRPAGFSLYNNRWPASITVTMLFVALCYGLVGLPYYETNDDMSMTAIVSGAKYAETPDEHMLFSHVYLGLVLKQLYLAMPEIPWYGILQTAAIVISMAVITWLVMGKSRRPLMMIGIASGALLVTCVRPLLLMQFTITATIAACAGAMLLLEASDRWHLRNRAIACVTGAVVMIAVACLIRGASAFLVLAVTTMFVICRFAAAPRRLWRRTIAQLLAFTAMFAIVVGLNYANESYYRGEWSDFYKINRANSSIREYRCDRIDSPLRRSMFRQVGWTPVDEKLHANWYTLDKNIHTVEKLTTLSKQMDENRAALFDLERAKSTVRALVTNKLFPLTFSLLFLIPFVNRRKFPTSSLLLTGVGVLSLCAFFLVNLKLPVHVFDSIILTLTLITVRYLSISRVTEILSRSAQPRLLVKRVAYTLLLLAALAPGFWLMSNLQVHLKFMARLERNLNTALMSLSPQPDQLFVTWAASPFVIVSPFTNMPKTFHNFKTIPVGSISPTPFVAKRLKEHGINDLLRELDRENVFLVSSDKYNVILIRMYAAEKLGKEVVLTPVPITPPFFDVFKVSYVTPANPETLKRDFGIQPLTEKQNASEIPQDLTK